MAALELRRNYPGLLMTLFALLLGILFVIFCSMYGCGGDGSGRLRENGESDEGSEEVSSGPWKRIPIAWIDAGNAVNPRVRASLDGSGKVHIVYFCGSSGADCPGSCRYTVGYMVGHMVLNRQSPYYLRYQIDQGPESIARIDNCTSLTLALTQDNCPVVAYQGGALRWCDNTEQRQSDAMISIRESGSDIWKSWIGAEGSLEGRAVDAEASEGGASGGDSFLKLAGNEVSAVTDSRGCIHVSYQLLSESCGASGSLISFTDLYYIKKDSSVPDAQVLAERVEEDQGDRPHFIGDHCVITLDRYDNPLIFYYAELSDQTSGQQIRGLRAARKVGGSWKREWIEQGCEIDSINCARFNTAGYGYAAVAYSANEYTTGPDGIHNLRYACTDWQFSSWQIQTVDDTAWCGEYCSLAFDSLGFPSIAYREMQGYSGYSLRGLKFAHFNGLSWDMENVSSADDIGLCNNLWLDDHNRPFICSYSSTQPTIYLFYRDPP